MWSKTLYWGLLHQRHLKMRAFVFLCSFEWRGHSLWDDPARPTATPTVEPINPLVKIGGINVVISDLAANEALFDSSKV